MRINVSILSYLSMTVAQAFVKLVPSIIIGLMKWYSDFCNILENILPLLSWIAELQRQLNVSNGH